MAVILSSQDAIGEIHGLESKRCSLCGSGPYVTKYPTIVWRGEGGELILCHYCCQALVPGLIADLIQIDAINRLHELGYIDFTLERKFLRPYRGPTRRRNEQS